MFIRADKLLILGALVLANAATAGPVEQEAPYVLAYIDPGTGSFLIQALVAAIAGIAVTSRLYWQRIKVFLGMSAKENDAGPPRDDE